VRRREAGGEEMNPYRIIEIICVENIFSIKVEGPDGWFWIHTDKEAVIAELKGLESESDQKRSMEEEG
jgi:hypothetical protein